jgi:hypothetical protein
VLEVTTQDYFEWFVYCNEYKMIMLDYFSAKAEAKAIQDAKQRGVALEVGMHRRFLF